MSLKNTLAPGFLIASPKLDDSLFERTVILMIHHDEEGAMGFIINRPLDLDFGSLLEMVDLEHERIRLQCYDRDVYYGGPVRTEQLWVIMNEEIIGNTSADFSELDSSAQMQFHDTWKLTGTADSIQGLAFSDDGTAAFRPFMGYAGWGPGQLEGEISDGSWLALDFDEEMVFQPPTTNMWDLALDRLGLDETTFMMMGKAGRA